MILKIMQIKRIIPVVFILSAFLWSCKEDKNKTQPIPETKEEVEKEIKNDAFDFSSENNSRLKKWEEYYQRMDENFDLRKFEFQNSSALTIMKGSIPGKLDSKFDSIYHSFLIFNPDKSQYIDMDSYHWKLSEEGELLFNADQEINLVDLKDSTVTRIAFRGPSFTVEDAFWESSHRIILLEGTYENSPNISLIDLDEKQIYSYTYPDTLPGKSNYKTERIRQKLK